MKKYIKYITTVMVVILIIAVIYIINYKKQSKISDDGKFKIVTSFYPVYIMTANITQGANNIELINMADINVGCIHNYTLSTEDMKELESADVFIENGLGLESFIEKVTTLNDDLQIINSSTYITDLIQENDETNPHIWTSIENYIKQVQTISDELINKNPENADLYKKNMDKYIQKLADLKSEYKTQLQEIKGKSAICLNESFEYLGKDVGLNLTMVHTDHEESTLSAEMLKNIIEKMKQENIKIIIVDINDDLKNAETIANETGAKIYQLDSGLTGNLNKDSYFNSMNGNLDKLKEMAKEE